MGCWRCCFWPSWLYWPCTVYQLISKDGHYPCAMLQYISPTSHWMRSPGANFRAGFYPCHKYILYQSTLFTNSPYWSPLDVWKIKFDNTPPRTASTKILIFETTIFDIKITVKIGLDFFILKFTEPLQKYLLTCQANSAFLGRFFCTVQQQLWMKGFGEFQIK